MGLDPAITAGRRHLRAYFGDKSSPLSDSANLAAATAGVDLYAHLRETVITSPVALAIALAVFWTLGRPRSTIDGAEKLAAIERVFHITPWLFAAARGGGRAGRVPSFRRSRRSSCGALAGGVLAVIVAPERVAAFADARAGVPAAIAQIKGVWLALASGYSRPPASRRSTCWSPAAAWSSMLDTIWLIIVALAFGGVVEKMGALERLMAPVIAKAKSDGALVASLVVAAIARPTSPPPTSTSPSCCPAACSRMRSRSAGYAPVVLSRDDRRHRDADRRADSVEQLRRLHGGDARRRHAAATRHGPSSTSRARSSRSPSRILGIRMLRAPAVPAQPAAESGAPATLVRDRRAARASPRSRPMLRPSQPSPYAALVGAALALSRPASAPRRPGRRKSGPSAR